MTTNSERDFILHFGEMGSRWGINRTVGQEYVLHYLSERPLCADDIVGALRFSRSNVSMGLKELQSWNLVRRRHAEHDRRDFFETPKELWEIVRTLASERKKRESDPTLTKLRRSELEADGNDRYSSKRITELRGLSETLTCFYDELERQETHQLVALLITKAKLPKVVTATGRVIRFGTQEETPK